jgi:bifunctional UDP-N-acetylglucosamine pyrophosphorylase/glucosamine-1-phosphate N-acetyltransferase
MEKQKIQAIILAAGKSSRFNTGSTKLSFTLCGQEMVAYPAKVLAQMNIPMTFVVGFQKQAIKQIIHHHAIPNATFIEQEKQLGTGHALLCSHNEWHAENILVLNGDIPLITPEIITELLITHHNQNATISFITTLSHDESAAGLGRVIHNDSSLEILEARHCSEEQLGKYPLNAGIYLFNRAFLEEVLPKIPANEKSGEIYITDLIKYASDKKLTIATTSAPFDYVRGVNTLKELWAAEHIKRSELLTHWMNKGVRFAAALNVCIDLDI